MIKNYSDDDIKYYYNIIGGKATNLCELRSMNLNIPRGFVISTEISESFFEIIFDKLGLKLSKAIYLKYFIEGKISKTDIEVFKNLILETDLPNNIVDTIHDLYTELNMAYVSVRSSANMEDSKINSFAGIFDTYLNIDRVKLIKAIKKCWCSLFSKRATEYYRKNNIDTNKIKMAVIIQQMIQPDSSGVCFTTDPVTGNANKIYIEAVYGLGEGIVSGKITPDSYIYDVDSRQIENKSINVQRYKIEAINFELRDIKVDEKIVSNQKIADNVILTLADKCNKIQKKFNTPQDIEFAVKDNLIYFLQSRPITT